MPTRTIVPCPQADFLRIATIIISATLDGPTFIDPKANAKNLTNALLLIGKIVAVQILANPPLEEKTDEDDNRLTDSAGLRTHRLRTGEGGV